MKGVFDLGIGSPLWLRSIVFATSTLFLGLLPVCGQYTKDRSIGLSLVHHREPLRTIHMPGHSGTFAQNALNFMGVRISHGRVISQRDRISLQASIYCTQHIAIAEMETGNEAIRGNVRFIYTAQNQLLFNIEPIISNFSIHWDREIVQYPRSRLFSGLTAGVFNKRNITLGYILPIRAHLSDRKFITESFYSFRGHTPVIGATLTYEFKVANSSWLTIGFEGMVSVIRFHTHYLKVYGTGVNDQHYEFSHLRMLGINVGYYFAWQSHRSLNEDRSE